MQTKTKNNLIRFLPYYKPYLPTVAADLFCALMTTVCDIALPLLVRKITDTASVDLAMLTPRLILGVAGLYIFLRIVDTAANYYMIRVGHMMGAKLETDMRNDLFSHLQELSFSFYSNTKVGQLMSRITRDLFDITEFSHHFPEEAFIALIKFVVSFLILARANLTLTIIIA